MKKIISILALAAMLVSCNQVSKEQYQQATNQNDSLMLVALQQGNEIADLNATLTTLSDKLSQINGQISMNSGDKADLKTQREQILHQLEVVQQNIATKEKELADLKKKYDGALGQNKELKKTIDRLERETKEYQARIEEYKVEIAAKDQQIAELGTNLDQTKTALAKESAENAANKETVAAQTIELNTVYYIVGTSKELKNLGLTESGGLFSSRKLTTSGFSTEAFTQVDKRTFTEIVIDDKSIKVLSSHPEESYTLEKIGKTTKLSIIDSEKFWSNSKFLVIKK